MNKDFKDFDLKLIREEVEKTLENKGIIKDDFENFFLKFLNKVKDKLGIKVPCLTCGVKFLLNNLDHECKEEDIWLNSYIKNSIENKKPNQSHIDKLRIKYPLNEDLTIAFRGINFLNKEFFDKFMEETKDGMYEFKTISSWSLDYSYAKRFARCQQIGAISDEGFRNQEIRNMIKEQANIMRYKGIILAIDLNEDNVLCDISDEEIGGFNENY